MASKPWLMLAHRPSHNDLLEAPRQPGGSLKWVALTQGLLPLGPPLRLLLCFGDREGRRWNRRKQLRKNSSTTQGIRIKTRRVRDGWRTHFSSTDGATWVEGTPPAKGNTEVATDIIAFAGYLAMWNWIKGEGESGKPKSVPKLGKHPRDLGSGSASNQTKNLQYIQCPQNLDELTWTCPAQRRTRTL